MNDNAKTKMGHNSKDYADYESLNPANPYVGKTITRIFDEIKEPSNRAMDMLMNIMDKFTEFGSGFKSLTDKEADWNTRAAYYNKQIMDRDSNPVSNKKHLRKLYPQKKLTSEDKFELRKQIDEDLWNVYELVSDAEATARVFEDKDNFVDWVEGTKQREDSNDKKD